MSDISLFALSGLIALSGWFLLSWWERAKLARQRRRIDALIKRHEAESLESEKALEMLRKELERFTLLSFSVPKTTAEILALAVAQSLRPLSGDEMADAIINNDLKKNFPKGKYVNLVNKSGGCPVYVTDGSDSTYSIADFDRVWEEDLGFYFMFVPMEGESKIPVQNVFDFKRGRGR